MGEKIVESTWISKYGQKREKKKKGRSDGERQSAYIYDVLK